MKNVRTFFQEIEFYCKGTILTRSLGKGGRRLLTEREKVHESKEWLAVATLVKGAPSISISTSSRVPRYISTIVRVKYRSAEATRHDEIDEIFESLSLAISLSRNHFKLKIKTSDRLGEPRVKSFESSRSSVNVRA